MSTTQHPLEWTGSFSPYPNDQGLAELFAYQAAARPEQIAVYAGTERLSYRELDLRASRMAHALRERGVGLETPVGVLLGPRPEQIVAQLAICKAGGTSVPLDPEYPRERLELMLDDARVPVVITDRSTAWPALAGRQCLDIDDSAGLARHPSTFAVEPGGGGRRTHILYTSGSTGKPKGVEILARGVSRLVLATSYLRIEAADRVAQLASFSFDAALFEVWGALLNGAGVVLLPKRQVLDPEALEGELVRQGVSVMFLTTALFNLVAEARPAAFRSLRYLLVGGEKANPRTLQAVLESRPPRHLLHVYGPTESTTFATCCELDRARVAGPAVPIGYPIDNTLAFLLDAERRPVAAGEPGELYLGGDGLARGYLDRPELTAERFVEVGGLGPAPLRLYRTGDLARRGPDGAIEFLGRADRQVKIRGFRIELEEIEAAMLLGGELHGAAITVHEDARGDKRLIAHAVPRDPAGFRAAGLERHLRQTLPPYMVPSRFVILEALPLNANGKVDRQALARWTDAPAASAATGDGAELSDALAAAVAAIWREVLDLDAVAPEDDFFARGGNSLLAARLVLKLRETFRIAFPIHTLYESGTLDDCIAAVRRAGSDGPPQRPLGDPAPWLADARLDADLRRAIEQAVAGAPARPEPLPLDGDIFLTGATGFLGAFLLRDLLATTGARVHCLVRAAGAAEGLARLRQALQKYGLWRAELAGRIVPVPGDLRQPRLGLSEAAFAALGQTVDAILHSGAQVSYIQPYAAHRPANVLGTTEVLRLAITGRLKPVHHVSTIAIFGPCGLLDGTTRLLEEQDLDEHADCLRYDIGYSASKWAAEKRVWEAAAAGLPVSVYRPGFILGDSRRGVGNGDDFIGRLVRGALAIGAYPDLPRQRKEFVPVDYVSRAILDLAAAPGTLGRAFHLVPPDPRESVDLNDFFELLADLGHPLERLPYSTWVERLVEDARTGDNPLVSLLPMLLDRVYGDDRTSWEMYENMPVYDARETVRALAGSTARFTRLDRKLLAKYLRSWLPAAPSSFPRPAAGFALPARRELALTAE